MKQLNRIKLTVRKTYCYIIFTMKHYSILLIAVFLFSCTNKNTVDMSDNHLWTIDVTKEYPVKDICLQDIADIEYIPLETKDSCLWWGRELKYMDEHYIIGANANVGVNIHDRTGKILQSFHHKGGGPEEYRGFTRVCYDKESDEMQLMCSDNKYLIYDSRGNYKRQFKSTYELVIKGNDYKSNYVRHFFILNETEFVECLTQNYYLRRSRQNGENLGEIKLPSKDSTLTLMFRQNGMLLNTDVTCHTKDENGYILTACSSDTIYLLTRDLQLKPVGVRSPPVSTMEVPVFLFPAKSATRYFFTYTVKKDPFFPRKLYMLDKKENKIYYLKNLFHNKDWEGKTHGLDIYGCASWADFPPNVIVECLDASKLCEAYENGELRGELKEIAKNIKADDNPVLMVVKFKE